MATQIRVKKRGPLVVEGDDFTLVGEDGAVIELPGKRVMLCRCGASRSLPICDGSHNRVPVPPSKTGTERAGSPLDPDPEMWAVFDGGVLRLVLDDFYETVYADPQLSPFFENVTIERAASKQHSFMRQIFTGEKLYFGDRPRNAHHAMVISDALFDHREELMMAALRRHGIPEKFVERWRAIDECFRKQIVKTEPFGRKLRGKTLPLEGYDQVVLSAGGVCDGCQGVVAVGGTVTYHVRTGQAYCVECRPGLATE